MCSYNKHIKFCTCKANLKIENSDWIILRKKSSNFFYFGESIISYHNNSPKDALESFYIDKIEEDLNSAICFDFDYIEEFGDRLIVKIKNSENENQTLNLEFEYKQSWKYCNKIDSFNDYIKFAHGIFNKFNICKPDNLKK